MVELAYSTRIARSQRRRWSPSVSVAILSVSADNVGCGTDLPTFAPQRFSPAGRHQLVPENADREAGARKSNHVGVGIRTYRTRNRLVGRDSIGARSALDRVMRRRP